MKSSTINNQLIEFTQNGEQWNKQLYVTSMERWVRLGRLESRLFTCVGVNLNPDTFRSSLHNHLYRSDSDDSSTGPISITSSTAVLESFKRDFRDLLSFLL